MLVNQEVYMKKSYSQTSFPTKLSYGMAGVGKDFSYGLVSAYLMYFYTEYFGLGAIAVGTLFLIARVFDGFNDPLMGIVIEKSNFKMGKAKPFILMGALLVLVFTVLCFSTPNIENKLTYAYITYIGWGFAFTIYSIACTSAASLMTRDNKDRTKLITYHRLGTLIGGVIPLIAIIPFSHALGGGADGLKKTVLILTLIAFICMVQFLFWLKEKVGYTGNVEHTKEDVISSRDLRDKKALLKNVPLLLLVVYSFLGLTKGIVTPAAVYFCKYTLGNESLMTSLSLISLGGTIVGVLLITPLLRTKWLDKKRLLIMSNIVAGFIGLLLYHMGYKPIYNVFILTFLSNIFSAMPLIIVFAMVADTVDYGEWRYGARFEAFSYAIFSFISKLRGAVSGWLVGVLLALFGYVAGQEQSTSMNDGFFMMICLIPSIGSFLSVIPLFFYPITGKLISKMNDEIRIRIGE